MRKKDKVEINELWFTSPRYVTRPCEKSQENWTDFLWGAWNVICSKIKADKAMPIYPSNHSKHFGNHIATFKPSWYYISISDLSVLIQQTPSLNLTLRFMSLFHFLHLYMQSCKNDKYWSVPVATASVSGFFYGDEIAAVGKVNITSCPTSSGREVLLLLKLTFNCLTVTASNCQNDRGLSKAPGNRETNSPSQVP